MRKLLLSLLPALLVFSCWRVSEDINNEPSVLFSDPEIVEFNTEQGYFINPITKDSIRPVLLPNGDTLQTGKALNLEGTVLDPESIIKPTSVKAGTPRIAPAHPNVTKAGAPVIQEAVPFPAKGDSAYLTINSKGDTLVTGIPIPVKARKVPARQPQPKKALPPRFKDNSPLSIQYLDVDQGMASSYIRQMAQDEFGNLWFGTWGAGLSRYNGANFTTFTESEGLSGNLVWSVLVDSKGNVWTGTEGGGVSMYDGKYFYHFTENEGMLSDFVFQVREDLNGNIWFSTFKGLTKYDGETLTHFTPKEGLLGQSINTLFVDSHGSIWGNSRRNGLSKFDGISIVNFTENVGLISSNIRGIAEDQDGNLWLATNRGITKYDGEYFYHYSEEQGMTNVDINEIKIDRIGNIWLATYGGGVIKFDGHTFTQISQDQGLSFNNIEDILEDRNGILWFTTYGGGVNIYDQGAFKHFTKNVGLSDSYVWSIIENKDGNILFGTDNGGVNIYNGTNFAQYTTDQGLSMDFVLTQYEDSQGNIWIGTYGQGLSVFDGTSFKNYGERQGLPNLDITSIVEDDEGKIWVSTYESGIVIFDGSVVTRFGKQEGLSNDLITTLYKDSQGNIWIGTSNSGLILYDGSGFTHITDREGLSHNHVWSIYEDKSGRMWFGTFGGGLNMFDGKVFTYFTEKQGLSNNIVWSINEDNKGRLWVGTDKGLNIVELSDMEEESSTSGYSKARIYNLEKADGIKGLDFYGNSVCLDRKNRMWWGTGKSLMMLDLDNYSLSQEPPVLQLNYLEISEKFHDFNSMEDSINTRITFDSVAPFLNYPVNPEMPFRNNHLTFYFAGIDWLAPHKVKYVHRILGLDNNWSKPSSDTKADYRNLPHGTYTFQVMAIGESGEWTEPLEYNFTILPPWWNTWWARSIYILIAISGIIGYVRWRTAALKKNQRALEKKVAIRTAQVVEEKERSEELLLNILPAKIAEELKEKGTADAQLIDQVTVLFTDFKGFSALAEKMSPRDLVHDIHECFSAFDQIMEKYGLEKIKTIGDAYMAAGGLPTPNTTHAHDVIMAAFEIRDFIATGKVKKLGAGLPYFEIRIGVHTGPVVAGIVGVKKFQYDIWGNTVNTAARMESSSEVGKVNVSQATYELIKDTPGLVFESRGKVEVKGDKEIKMWYAEKIS